MRVLIRSIAVTLAFAFCSSQQVQAETPALSFDLNPLLRACLSPGADCLADLPLIGIFFDRNQEGPVTTKETICKSYMKNWCVDFNDQDSQSGFTRCRQAKMAFYEEISRAKGTWPYAHIEGKRSSFWLNLGYMQQVENSRTQAGQPPYFNCNVNQQIAFIKARCGNILPEQWPHGGYRPSTYTQDDLCRSKKDL